MKAVFRNLVGGLGLLAIPLAAHHSFQAEFDAAKAVTLTGVVTKLEWTNPHAHFYIDVKGPDGQVENWNLELASPNVLRRLGWSREIFKVGDTVTVCHGISRFIVQHMKVAAHCLNGAVRRARSTNVHAAVCAAN